MIKVVVLCYQYIFYILLLLVRLLLHEFIFVNVKAAWIYDKDIILFDSCYTPMRYYLKSKCFWKRLSINLHCEGGIRRSFHSWLSCVAWLFSRATYLVLWAKRKKAPLFSWMCFQLRSLDCKGFILFHRAYIITGNFSVQPHEPSPCLFRLRIRSKNVLELPVCVPNHVECRHMQHPVDMAVPLFGYPYFAFLFPSASTTSCPA